MVDLTTKEWYKKWQKQEHFNEEEYNKELTPIFEDVCEELAVISHKLFKLLPDYSIGPEERIERLARVVPESILESENMLTARTKLNNITRRLNELVHDKELSNIEKIDYLVAIADQKAPLQQNLIEKLEYIDDFRRTDIGRRF